MTVSDSISPHFTGVDYSVIPDAPFTAVVDYGGGNLASVVRALQFVSPDCKVALVSKPEHLDRAARIVLPGQGAMQQMLAGLQRLDLASWLINNFGKKPMLGICVGMQALFDSSEEGDTKGLCLVSGQVKKFNDGDINIQDHHAPPLKIPHMGWSEVDFATQAHHPLWAGINNHSRFYFAHSYYCVPNDKTIVAGTVNYGINYAVALACPQFFAVQFHPEKSGRDGLQLLKNFSSWQG